ncbi:MAG: hypothetical protein ACKOSR_05780 [Flavobacteriales bacterium]
MSEDRFYSHVRSVMSEHRPEVPASVYAGMRKKLWWSNFTRLSVTRFNMWYALLIIGGLGAWAGLSIVKQDKASQAMESPMEPTKHEMIESAPLLTQESSQSPKEGEPSAASASTEAKETAVVKKQSAQKEIEVQNEEIQKEAYPVAEKQDEKAAPTAESQKVEPTKQGSRKGLKITTYERDQKEK